MAKPAKKPSKLAYAALALLLVLLVVVNAAVPYFSSFLNNFFSAKRVDAELSASTLAVAEANVQEVVAEGTVLLRNENNVLPLAADQKVNVFGWGSLYPIYGGTGSGSSSDAGAIDFYDALELAGIEYNKDLFNFYDGLGLERPAQGGYTGSDYTMVECTKEQYTDEILANAKEYSDTAIVFLSRIGGEGADIPRNMYADDGYYGVQQWIEEDNGKHYLELSDDEVDMFELIKDDYENIIVIVNSSNAMEMGFVEEYNVDSALWIGGPGATGMKSVAEILNGTVNPSGKLPDTWIYDLTKEPTYYNLGNYTYTNVNYKALTYDESGWVVTGMEDAPLNYMDYEEGIYVGYRYYETRYIDNVTGECDEEAYDALVQYPFGYGLSYTTFTQEMSELKTDADGNISVDVTVTNTGDVAGKDVVQIYYTAPYTIGGIEKSHVVLCSFDKTEMLEPGASETLTLTFNEEDMASYDDNKIKSTNGAYVLEAGDYEIKLMSNAHDVIDSKTYTVAKDVIYDDEHDGKRSTDGIAATNLFEDCEDDGSGEITYFSRADWEGTMPTEECKSRAASDDMNDLMYQLNHVFYTEEYDVVTDADNGLTLNDLVDADKDAPRWQQLVEQMSVSELRDITGLGGHQTAEIKSIGKAVTTDENGPTGISAMQANDENGASYCSEPLMAATFNYDLIYKLGEGLGAEMLAHGLDGIYGPAMNIHRSAFSGRNFEYYSEDAYLSYKMGAAEVSGIQSNEGVYTYVKHYAINDQETNRERGTIWANEQAVREIYLKAFEGAIKEGGSLAIMESMNMYGPYWTGGSEALMTTILDEEWGFEGFIVTDYYSAGYMNCDNAIRAGVDTMDDYMGSFVEDETNSETIYYMQQSAKDILYVTKDSVAQQDYSTSMFTSAQWIQILASAVIVVLMALIVVYIVKKNKAYKAAQIGA